MYEAQRSMGGAEILPLQRAAPVAILLPPSSRCRPRIVAMRMPSTPSLWPALLASLLLHAVVALAAWWLVDSDQRVPVKLVACVEETTDRLHLSVVFGSVGKSRLAPQTIDTQVDPPPTLDPDAQLEPTRPFNPVESLPLPLKPVVADHVASGLPTPSATGTAGAPPNSGNPSGQGAGEQGSGGPGGTSFFQVGAPAHSVVYVLDCSASMGWNKAFSHAKAELLATLQQLPPDVQFQVLPYNHQEPHCLVAPDRLRLAQPEVVAQFVQALTALLSGGSTNHVAALRRALLLNPEVIYLVTDGGDLTLKSVQEVSAANQGRTIIHVIEMVGHRTPPLDDPLLQLARGNRGTYRAVSTAQEITAIPGLLP